MDVRLLAQTICKLEIGQTINARGQIQDCKNWSTSISRRYYGDSHITTCRLIKETVDQVISYINANQNREEYVAMLPDLGIAISRYIETCNSKKYSVDVQNELLPVKARIEQCTRDHCYQKKE